MTNSPGQDEALRPGSLSERLGEVACQFSVYPLRRPRIGDVIEEAIAAAAAAGVSLKVQNLSTVVYGSEEQVFTALRSAFRAAQAHGPAVLAATLTAGMPTDEEVNRIQQAHAGREGGAGE